MSMNIAVVPHIACVQAIASVLLLSSCGGGSSAEDGLLDDDCTPTINLSTQLELQVDINGNISTVPVANNTVSGCGSSATGERFDSSLITNRFENTENFDVWDCIRTDGTSLQYALLSYSDFTHLNWKRFAFEIDPRAEDLVASQQLYAWREPPSTNADTITFWSLERISLFRLVEGVESEWTGITVATENDMSFTSSTEGVMQCRRTVSAVDLAASRFNVPCEFRGPLSAC